MDWSEHLLLQEEVVWEGRPAPRCYTWRNWPHSLFGLVLLLAALAWFYSAINLQQRVAMPIFGWIPLPFLLFGLYLAVGHLLRARLEWESIFYAVTDRRLLLQRGLLRKRVCALPLDQLVWFRLRPFSNQLATVAVRAANGQRLDFACIEQPHQLTELLEAALVANGVVTPAARATEGDNRSSAE